MIANPHPSSVVTLDQSLTGKDVVSVSVSRQSRELTTSRLDLVSVSDQYVSGLVSVLAQNFSASRLGLGLFHVVEIKHLHAI